MTRTAVSRSTRARPSAPGRPGWLRVAAILVAVVYCCGISLYLLTHGGWPTPDYLIPPLLLAAVALGRGPAFLLDWGPFLLLLLGWQVSAGIADQLGRPVHLLGPLELERALFGGTVPTVELQRRLYDPVRSQWYDWLGVLQHALHFVLPVLAGFLLWLESRRVYWRYITSVLLLFFAGFATYALYPAAPPWMAGLFELTPPVHRIAIETLLRLPASTPVGLAYRYMSPNTVAAIPSLHAALPLLITLVLLRVKGRRATPMFLYTAVMGFYLVYLGEHYVIDVLLGYLYAAVAFLLVWLLPWRRIVQTARLPRPPLPRMMPAPAGSALGAALMPALAVASIAIILFTLRPGRPPGDPGPLVPGLQVQAGDADLLDPRPCGDGASPSLTAGGQLVPVAGRYAAFLFDVDAAACYVLTANTHFSPPSRERLGVLAERAPIRLRPLPSLREGVEYFSVYSGYPSEQLLAKGFAPEQRLLLVAALAEVVDQEVAAGAVEFLASLAFTPGQPPEAPPAEPEPEVMPPSESAEPAAPLTAPADTSDALPEGDADGDQ